ncbi:hypothetical protein [Aestuariivirga litoralis]|uniref:hypothetical protein n=1 Tax=Aestuariivirga litoralis TaxID=2650924 RepID=UPI0018C492DF|nr:hypothetical protein [Aestuariivirga litoralis]MBG1233322.1 hypothetical protein [Aestuariivirga litoralis]
MRNIFMGFTAALLLSSAAVAADQKPTFTCDEFATAYADEATGDDMQRAGAFDTAEPGKVLMIGAGQKIYIPQRQTSLQGFAPKTAWENLHDYRRAYHEGRRRCLWANSINVQVQK